MPKSRKINPNRKRKKEKGKRKKEKGKRKKEKGKRKKVKKKKKVKGLGTKQPYVCSYGDGVDTPVIFIIVSCLSRSGALSGIFSSFCFPPSVFSTG